MADRCAKLSRKTKETDISVSLNIDGTGKSNIDTGIGFFNHMLEGFSKHGFFDLDMTCDGDLNVDCHHTIEDCGIVLGNAIAQAVGDKKGIKRFGSFIYRWMRCLYYVPLTYQADRTCSLTVSYLRESRRYGYRDGERVFHAVSYSAAMNLHIKVLTPGNNHHMIEAMFKAFAKALDGCLHL